MPVLMVRNTLDGPTVLSSDPKGTHFIEWAANGDDNGNDVQIVPEEFREIPSFLRAVQRGILVIENPEDNPDVSQAIERQNQAWRNRTEKAAQKAVESIDQEVKNDYVTLQCVGPNTRGGGRCDNEVTVKERGKNDKPPLCSTHADLAPQFVPTEGEVITDGKSIKTWTRVSMGKRQKQES